MSHSAFSLSSVRRIESELSKLDAAVQAISLVTNGTIRLHYHQPLRRIDVQMGELLKSIVISPVFRDPVLGDIEGNIGFAVSLFVIRDVGERRFWWHALVAQWSEVPDGYQEQVEFLQRCWEDLKKISESDLKPIDPAQADASDIGQRGQI
jgi:hypothetical protein